MIRDINVTELISLEGQDIWMHPYSKRDSYKSTPTDPHIPFGGQNVGMKSLSLSTGTGCPARGREALLLMLTGM